MGEVIRYMQEYRQVLMDYRRVRESPKSRMHNPIYLMLATNAYICGGLEKSKEIMAKIEPEYFKEDIFKDIERSSIAAQQNYLRNRLRLNFPQNEFDKFNLIVNRFVNLVKHNRIERTESIDYFLTKLENYSIEKIRADGRKETM